MVGIKIVLDFDDRRRASRVVDEGKVTRHLVAEDELRLVCSRNAANRYDVRERHDPAGNGLAAIEPDRIGNGAERKPESHIIRMGSGCYRIHIPARIDLHVFRSSLVATALHDSLADSIALCGSHKIVNGILAIIAEPVVHPFHDVPGHVANLSGSRRGTHIVCRIRRVAQIPAVLYVPTGLRRKGPFRFGRQAERHCGRTESEPLQVRTMLVMVNNRFRVGVRRIESERFALRIREQYRIVIGDIGSGHLVVLARHDKARDVLHDRIEIAASHLAPAHEIIVAETDFHHGALIALRGNFLGSEINVLARSRDAFKSGKRIRKRHRGTRNLRGRRFCLGTAGSLFRRKNFLGSFLLVRIGTATTGNGDYPEDANKQSQQISIRQNTAPVNFSP